MFKLILVSCLAASVSAQSLDAKNAKILKEQRFDAGDGRFGAAFAAEDGTVFREETTSDGERIGQYSYIGQDGNTITVRYSAGKDGFRILEGAHIPEGANGLQSAPFDPNFAETEEPQQSVEQQPQQQQIPQQQAAPVRQQQFRPQPQQQFRPQQQQQQQPSGDFNPFINPADPTHRNFQHNTNAAQFKPQPTVQRQQPQPQPQQQFSAPRQQPQQFSVPDASSVPACANCDGFNPFINPADSSHSQLFQQQQQQQQQPIAPAFRRPASTFVPQQQQQQQQAPNPSFSFQQRTQAKQQPLQPAFSQPQQQPSTFRQPQQQPSFSQPLQPQANSLNNFQGNLNLNRFDTGFNFDFSSSS